MRWLLTDKVPLLDGEGRVTRILVTAMDVTERQKAEEALREADRQKDEFLAILAHELRNPLTPISSGIEIMRRSLDQPEAIARALALIEGQVRDMVRLVDDLLDFSRVSRGSIELHRQVTNLADIVQHALETCQPLTAQAGQELRFNAKPAPVMVEADATRLAQAFTNLLSNASKFTPAGGCISVSLETQSGEALVRVQDNGIGIPAGMQGKIFDMFSQVNRSLAKQHGGLGVGLNIVKRLVELHGGSVEAHSAGHGQGSEFIVRLALSHAAYPGKPAAPPLEQPPSTPVCRKILVVDDNPDVAASNAWLLEIMGHEVYIARDGKAALAMAAELRPVLILLDIGMPGLDGYEVCRRIRAEPWGQAMMIVALTGWGQQEDKKKSQASGFDHHLVKPFQPGELEQVLNDLGQREQ
jgi:CheY-like chemotaxis protein